MMVLDMFYTFLMGDIVWLWLKKKQSELADTIKMKMGFLKEDAHAGVCHLLGYQAPIREERPEMPSLKQVIKDVAIGAAGSGVHAPMGPVKTGSGSGMV